ncbi:hypothetical protein [Massilia genomosp. 1]|uniref:Uncharacterized protein n=1 Tax=Massilia genomosp. 1 TaxID=2609280 RepID=A0ABX0N440_9BURK|nr:hypothetical protein [Massilia genomosp. 1]NHZ66622.1 hypothetical protein [Massilia genomosp. 1]
MTLEEIEPIIKNINRWTSKKIIFLYCFAGMSTIMVIINLFLYFQEWYYHFFSDFPDMHNPHFMKDVLGISLGLGFILAFPIFPYILYKAKKEKKELLNKIEERKIELQEFEQIAQELIRKEAGEEQDRLRKIETIEQDQRRKEEEQAEFELQLAREVQRKRVLAEVDHEITLKAIETQMKILGEHKEKGLAIDKEIFEMRKTILDLEGQENKAMIDALKSELNELESVK